MPSIVAAIRKERIAGALLIALGVLILTAPFAAGRWSIAVLGLPLIVLAIAEAFVAFRSQRGVEAAAYLPAALAFLAGNVLLLSSALVGHGLLVLLIAILMVDGFGKIIAAHGRPKSDRLPSLLNGLVDLGCAVVIWYLSHFFGIVQAIGIIVGAYIVGAGWRLLMMLHEPVTPDTSANILNLHPDQALGLSGNESFARLRSRAEGGSQIIRGADLLWMSTLGLVFFAIHAGRMPLTDDILGRISPFVATIGDVLMTLVFAMTLMLPARLAWRRVTRPIERLGWSLRLGAEKGAARMNPVANWLMAEWLEARFGFSLRLREARLSLPYALILLLRLGLPITAFFVAINPIWGFSWYFNTESWATGIYQKLTESRVDPWRASMIDAVSRAYGGGDELFRIDPQGTNGSVDFSFLVIGDPGEGDASQYALVSRYLRLGQSDDVKFLVISSDVVYPAGSIEDYEQKFYLPFQGFAKPIYAIPGNHDWFDALESFNANFLEATAARSAIQARIEADLGLTGTNQHRIENLVASATRLRRLYGVSVGKQRAPFFELQSDDFALLAIDTGILRAVDDRQLAWIKRALDRSRGKFTMAIVGHPRIAAGRDTSAVAERRDAAESSSTLAALYRLLAVHDVKIVMAGDTHDFEYYRENVTSDGFPRVMHHFVNGGGGAYLSIGTALDFARQPASTDWAFYPKADLLRAKLDAEMPLWKQPFWYWIKWLNAWPFSVEAFSGIFDFNRAPFLQSFMEVRVERSKKRVVLVLNGAHGPLRWRDLQIGGAVMPAGAQLDDPVEFSIAMDG